MDCLLILLGIQSFCGLHVDLALGIQSFCGLSVDLARNTIILWIVC